MKSLRSAAVALHMPMEPLSQVLGKHLHLTIPDTAVLRRPLTLHHGDGFGIRPEDDLQHEGDFGLGQLFESRIRGHGIIGGQ
jgi:hypothetical protein